MGALRYLFLLVDIGFLAYWLVTLLHLIPGEYLFQDYQNELLVAWNWSFLPLDLLISFTGLSSLVLYRRGSPRWRLLALASLTLTSISGLQAIAFWVIRRDFMLEWWLPNAFLLVYPIYFIWALSRELSAPPVV